MQKTIGLIREAARNRADLVVFPESYLPAFPLWAALAPPISNHAYFQRLASQSLVPCGPEIALLRQTCADSKIFAHIGFNERSPVSLGCLWNSSILISDRGEVLNHHRKLMPTFWEKLVWSPGDGKGLRVVDTERCGKVGGLICGENTNPLARWSLMAQGEQVHISSWPAVWPTRPASAKSQAAADEGGEVAKQGKQYDNVAANLTRTAAHCFEAKCFGVLCSGYMDKPMRDDLVAKIPGAEETLDSLSQGASLFLDSTGKRVGEQIVGEEGVVYADLDLNECVEPKQFHDVVGTGYQRYDVFDVRVDRRRRGVEGLFGKRRGDEAELWEEFGPLEGSRVDEKGMGEQAPRR